MLISVTNFFRDREAFDALEHDVLPRLQPPPGGERELRAWVVGCASGEEAYSLAMLLQEDRERRGQSRTVPGVRHRHRRACAGHGAGRALSRARSSPT